MVCDKCGSFIVLDCDKWRECYVPRCESRDFCRPHRLNSGARISVPAFRWHCMAMNGNQRCAWVAWGVVSALWLAVRTHAHVHALDTDPSPDGRGQCLADRSSVCGLLNATTCLESPSLISDTCRYYLQESSSSFGTCAWCANLSVPCVGYAPCVGLDMYQWSNCRQANLVSCRSKAGMGWIVLVGLFVAVLLFTWCIGWNYGRRLEATRPVFQPLRQQEWSQADSKSLNPEDVFEPRNQSPTLDSSSAGLPSSIELSIVRNESEPCGRLSTATWP